MIICLLALTLLLVMERLKLFVSRINIPKVIKAAERTHLWPELVFLYIKYDEHVSTEYRTAKCEYLHIDFSNQDNTAFAITERAAGAWEHNQFKEVIVKVASLEMLVTLLMFSI